MVKNVFIFSVGAAIGAAVAWTLAKKKYLAIADKEIESVKEAFEKMADKKEEPKKEEKHDVKVPSDDSAISEKKPETVKKKDIQEKETTNYQGMYSKKEDPAEKAEEKVIDAYEEIKKAKKSEPRIISADYFGDEDYDTVSYIYYADGILADENDTPVDDILHTVGTEYLNVFAETGEDVVYVRNDRLKLDFEILRDLGNFSDLLK